MQAKHHHFRILMSWGVIAVVGGVFFVYAKTNVNRQRWLEMQEREKLRAEMDLARRREVTKF